MVLTKSEISENLFEKLKISKQDSKEFVEFFFEEIRKSLETGEDVKFSGFGNFQLKYKKERPGRNPRTGENVTIKKRRVVIFKSGHKLRNIIEKYLVKIE